MKKKKHNDLFLNLKISGVVFAISFGIGLFERCTFELSFWISFAFASLIFLCAYLNNYFGKKKHENIIASQLFMKFLERGFKIEEHNDYHGVIGIYNNLTIRLYYDWNKSAKAFFSFGDFVINIYYEPLFKNNTEEPDVERITELNKTESNIKWKTNYTSFSIGYLIRRINYFPNLKYNTVIQELDFCIDLINKNNLKLISLEQLSENRKKYEYIFEPLVESYIYEN
jgi:hypothetical protein